MLILMAAGIFVAMGLQRYTLRKARRRDPTGIRWRGIQWQQPTDDDDPADDA